MNNLEISIVLLIALVILVVAFPHVQSMTSSKHYKIKPIPICKVTKAANGAVVKSTYHETEGNVSAIKRTCA